MFRELLKFIEKEQLEGDHFPPSSKHREKLKELMSQHLDSVRGTALECEAIIKQLESQGGDQSAKIAALQKIIKKLVKYEIDLTEKIKNQFLDHNSQMLKQVREGLKASEEGLKKIVKQMEQFFKNLHDEELKELKAKMEQLEKLYRDLYKIDADIFKYKGEVKQKRGQIAKNLLQIQASIQTYNTQVAAIDQQITDHIADSTPDFINVIKFLTDNGVPVASLGQAVQTLQETYAGHARTHHAAMASGGDGLVDCAKFCAAAITSMLPSDKGQGLMLGLETSVQESLLSQDRENYTELDKVLRGLEQQKEDLKKQLDENSGRLLGDNVELERGIASLEETIESLQKRREEAVKKIREVRKEAAGTLLMALEEAEVSVIPAKQPNVSSEATGISAKPAAEKPSIPSPTIPGVVAETTVGPTEEVPAPSVPPNEAIGASVTKPAKENPDVSSGSAKPAVKLDCTEELEELHVAVDVTDVERLDF